MGAGHTLVGLPREARRESVGAITQSEMLSPWTGHPPRHPNEAQNWTSWQTKYCLYVKEPKLRSMPFREFLKPPREHGASVGQEAARASGARSVARRVRRLLVVLRPGGRTPSWAPACPRSRLFPSVGQHGGASLIYRCLSPAEFPLLSMEPSKKMDPAGSLQPNPPLKPHADRGAGPAGCVPEQGGYKERFVKAVEDKYKCEKCRLVLCNPKQTECGHRFCETCMAAVLRWAPCAAGGLASLCSRSRAPGVHAPQKPRCILRAPLVNLLGQPAGPTPGSRGLCALGRPRPTDSRPLLPAHAPPLSLPPLPCA